MVQTIPSLLQSAFRMSDGRRIIIYTSEFAGITSYFCDENYKPIGEPFAQDARENYPRSYVEYHRNIRNMHKGFGNEFIKEHSSDIDGISDVITVTMQPTASAGTAGTAGMPISSMVFHSANNSEPYAVVPLNRYNQLLEKEKTFDQLAQEFSDYKKKFN